MARAKAATAKDVALRTEAPPPAVLDYGEDTGHGYEGQDSSHVSIPFLALLQSNSPQVTDEDSTLKAGMLYNTVTGDAWSGKEGVVFVPSWVDHLFTEWVPRDKGGGGGAGFRGVHPAASEVVARAKVRPRRPDQKRSVLLTDEGNELIETFYMYGVVCDADGSVECMAVIPFTSTKIKVYRGYSTRLNMFNWKRMGLKGKPPLYANSLRITTVGQENTQGKFYNFVLTPLVDADVAKSMLAPDDPRYLAARDVWTMVRSGEAKASFETERSTGSSEGASGDDEIPF